MKRLIVRENIISSALINPNLSNQLTIRVKVLEGGEGPIPHVHVYHDSSLNPKRCSLVRLDKHEYSKHHHENNIPLDRKQKKQFIEVMNSIWPRFIWEYPDGSYRKASGYESAVMTWVDCYEHGDFSKFNLDDNGNLVMPDYSLL